MGFNLHLFSTHTDPLSCYPPLLLPSSATCVRYLSLLTHTGFPAAVRPLSPATESREDRVINWFATQWHCCGFLPLRVCVCVCVCVWCLGNCLCLHFPNALPIRVTKITQLEFSSVPHYAKLNLEIGSFVD